MLEPQDATDSPGSRCRAIAQAVVRARDRHERTAQKLRRHPRASLARRAIESSPRSTAATVFDARTLSQSGTQVIVIPYSFAMKLRPLRRACLASASVNLGASGSESPMAPRKARNALETFPAAIISSKTGAGAQAGTLVCHGGFMQKSHARLWQGLHGEAPGPPTYRHCARARLPERQYAR